MDVGVKFGDSTLNIGLIIRLVAGWSRFTDLYALFSCSLQPTGSSWTRHIQPVYVTDGPQKVFTISRSSLEPFLINSG